MNVFVLSTGRCGSTTFAKASQHIGNYTAGHETRSRLLGDARLEYPARHIEADNRLTWMLGRLDQAYGDHAIYVHLTRDPVEVVKSFNQRWDSSVSIVRAYRDAMLMGAIGPDLAVCVDYVNTVTANIRAFLKDKTRAMHFRLETAEADWPRFWEMIGAEGDFEAAMAEWGQRHNATLPGQLAGRER